MTTNQYGIKLGPTTSAKLQGAGVISALDLFVVGPQELAQITGMKYEEAEQKYDELVAYLEDEEIIDKQSTLEDIKKHKAKTIHLKSGCDSLDTMLSGGLATQGITEIYGQEGAGKTQFVLSLTVEALHRGEGVIYMDCEGTFELERLEEIAQSRGYELDTTKLEVMSTQDTHTIKKMVKTLPTIIQKLNVKLIVVDGMVGIFRFEYDQGRGELNDRQNHIKYPLRHLKRIAEYMNIAVAVTNQVTANPDAGWGADPIKPIGGHIFGHTARYILKMNKGSKSHRTARLVKSNKDPQYDCEFWLNEAGVWDSEKISKKPLMKSESELKDNSLLLE